MIDFLGRGVGVKEKQYPSISSKQAYLCDGKCFTAM
jgi:hypothetical protein